MNKSFRLLHTLFVIIVMSCCLTACSDDDDDRQSSSQSSLTGSWYYESRELDIYAQFTDNRFYFEIETEYDQIDVFGTYTYDGNIFRVTESQSYDDTDLFQKGDTYVIIRKDSQITIRIEGKSYTLNLDDDDYDYV